MTTAEILRAARAKIARGWWDGSSDGPAENTCAEIAIREVQGLLTGWTDAHKALCRAIGITTDYEPANIYKWNDGSSKSEVLAAFDKAIASVSA